jgi:hypothetical protein
MTLDDVKKCSDFRGRFLLDIATDNIPAAAPQSVLISNLFNKPSYHDMVRFIFGRCGKIHGDIQFRRAESLQAKTSDCVITFTERPAAERALQFNGINIKGHLVGVALYP